MPRGMENEENREENMKRVVKIAAIAAALIGGFMCRSVSASAVSECPAANNGMQGHVWEQTDAKMVSSHWSDGCSEFGNPGNGRTCSACGKQQDFYTCGDWVYGLRADGTAEIVRCDKPELEYNPLILPEELDGIPVTAIGDNAFQNCYYLGSVVIPSGITHIGDFAFAYCQTLKSIEIPDNVVSVGCNPFLGTDVEIQLSANRKDLMLMEGSLYDRQGKRLVYAWYGDRRGSYFTVSEGTQEIGDYAFASTNFSSVSFPKNVRIIGNHAFDRCSRLQEIYGLEEITQIGDFAFYACGKLGQLRLPESVTCIGINPFADTSVQLFLSPYNDSYVTQGNLLFEKETKKLVSCSDTQAAHIIVPDGTVEIGAYAFMDCSGLMWLDLPQSVSKIGEGAFSGCGTLNNIIIPDGVRTIEKDTFALCNRMESALIPETVTQIGEHAFFNCQSLYRVSLPSRLDTLGEGAFQGCSSLWKMEIPQGITQIPRCAFDGCLELEEVTLPAGLTKIAAFAFSYCEKLDQLVLPDSLAEIEEYAFFQSPALENLQIPKGAAYAQP